MLQEFGLAVPDVPAAVAQLRDALRLPVFGAAAADFTPLGDPDGLLIVVRRGRPWFPTNNVLPSEGPLAVTIDAGEQRSLRLMPDGTLHIA